MNKYVKENFRDMIMFVVPLLICVGLVSIPGLIGGVIANEVGCVLGCCVGVILSLIFIPIYAGICEEREEKRKINEKYVDALERMKRHLREKGEEL